MENKCEEEFTGFTFHSVTWILVILLVSSKHNFLECADVHRQIMPTGLVDIIINILGFHYTYYVICIKHTVIVKIGLVVHLYPTLNVVLWNVEPETNSFCIFKNKSIAVNTESDPSILLGV